MSKATRLMRKALQLAKSPRIEFLDLAHSIRAIRDLKEGHLQTFLETSGMKPRKAYYLAEISELVDQLNLPKKRLERIGWTKLPVLAKHLKLLGSDGATNDEVKRCLALAERTSAQALPDALRDQKGDVRTRTVLMYLTNEQYTIFKEVIEANGARVGAKVSPGKRKP